MPNTPAYLIEDDDEPSLYDLLSWDLPGFRGSHRSRDSGAKRRRAPILSGPVDRP